MNTLISLAAAVLSGAVSGGLVGFLVSYLQWWGKDCRDVVLRHRGMPLPRDRVFHLSHRPGLVLGALFGAWPPLVFDLPPLWAAFCAALLPLCVLASSLLVLGVEAIYARIVLLGPSRAQLDADLRKRAQEALDGKEVAEAVGIAQQNGWHYEVVEVQPIEEHPPTGRSPRPLPDWRSRLTIYVRDGKVTGVDVPRL